MRLRPVLIACAVVLVLAAAGGWALFSTAARESPALPEPIRITTPQVPGTPPAAPPSSPAPSPATGTGAPAPVPPADVVPPPPLPGGDGDDDGDDDVDDPDGDD